jgi:hypothetical protein
MALARAEFPRPEQIDLVAKVTAAEREQLNALAGRRRAAGNEACYSCAALKADDWIGCCANCRGVGDKTPQRAVDETLDHLRRAANMGVELGVYDGALLSDPRFEPGELAIEVSPRPPEYFGRVGINLPAITVDSVTPEAHLYYTSDAGKRVLVKPGDTVPAGAHLWVSAPAVESGMRFSNKPGPTNLREAMDAAIEKMKLAATNDEPAHIEPDRRPMVQCQPLGPRREVSAVADRPLQAGDRVRWTRDGTRGSGVLMAPLQGERSWFVEVDGGVAMGRVFAESEIERIS